MVRAWSALAWALVLLATTPAALAYRDCYLSGQVCMDYDYRASQYAEVQHGSLIAGGGRYNEDSYTGYTVHVFSPGTYVSVYDGSWYGYEFTLIGVGVNNKEYVWYYQQDSRASERPGAYHCFSVTGVYSRCGTGLP